MSLVSNSLLRSQATPYSRTLSQPSKDPVKDIFTSSQAMTPKDPLEISFYQKAAFGMNVAGFISNSLGFSGLSTPLHYFGLAFQVFSGVTLIQQAFQSPSIQTATPLTCFALTFTSLAPIIQGISTYTMCSDSLHQAKNLIDKRDGKNDPTIARNLFIYGVNAFSSCYHFSQNLPLSSGASLNTENVETAKQTLFPTTTPTSINEQTVKEAFRSRAKVLHPDKGGTSEAFTELQNARDTLLKSLDLPSVETWNLFSLVKQVSSAFFQGLESLDRFTRFPGAEGAIVQGSCQDHIDEAPQFFEPILDALKTGQYRLEAMTNTNSGVYLVKKSDGATVAIFKPSDEDNGGPQNRDLKKRKPMLTTEDMYFKEEIPGFSAERQALAFELDFGSGACMPMGISTELESDLFVDVKAEANRSPARKQKKAGYLQEWISDTKPLVQYHPAHKRQQKSKTVKNGDPYEIQSNPILNDVPLDEFQKIAIMDALLFNTDRHPGNILIREDSHSIPHMIPIDSDRILPGKLKHMRTGLFLHARAKERLTHESLTFIDSLNPDEIAFKVEKAGLPYLAARNAKILTLALKAFGPDFSLSDIFRFITTSSRLSDLVERSERRSLINFSTSEQKDYKKSEEIRKKAWEGKTLTEAESTWQENYLSQSKDEIRALKEKYFWVYFERGLKRELNVAKMKITRNIAFGTTFVDGNPERDALSNLVSENQQSFAKLWDLEGRVVTKSLLAKKCDGPYGSPAVDCVPYWNKIEVLREWLNEPPNPEGKEEWYILADDDMPVTNMNFDPYEAIDLVRQGKDTSIIIVRDIQLWKEGDPDLSVNTGLLIVRKDKKSQDFMEKLWKKRNDPTGSSKLLCPTLGTCKNQDVLHEQEAFARVLKEDRSLLGKTVTVIKPRDTYKGKEIALNTFNRDGYFANVKNGWGSGSCISFDFDDSRSTPDGAHRTGDAMGQTAGVPILGRDCNVPGSKTENLREKKLRKMLDNIARLEHSPLAASELTSIQGDLQSERSFATLLKRSNTAKQKILHSYRSEIENLIKAGASIPLLSQIKEDRLKNILKYTDAVVALLQAGVNFNDIAILDYDVRKMILNDYKAKVLKLVKSGVKFGTISKINPLEFEEKINKL